MGERAPLLSTGPIDNLRFVADKATQFNNEVAQLSKLADCLGTPKDTEQLRNQLRIKREDCANFAKSTLQILKRVQMDRSEKVKHDKMVNQINEIFKRFQRISKDSIEKERLTPPVISSVRQPSSGSFSNYADPEERAARGAVDEMEANLRALEYQSYGVDQAIIEERDSEMKFLESEMKGLNEMFVDIAVMIEEQGKEISTIEDNTYKASAGVQEGVTELQKASEYQKSSRKKLCCLLLISVIILAIIGIVIGVYFGALK